MLLVKSNGLKSSDRKTSLKTWGWILSGPISLLPSQALAAPESLSSPASLASIFLSLLVVVGAVFAVALFMRRFTVTQAGNGQMKVVASMMAGTKERIVVLDVGGEQHLIGVTSQNINHLAKLETPLVTAAAEETQPFKDKLVQAMAGRIQQSTGKSKGGES